MGSDDLYFPISLRIRPESVPLWQFGVGSELRIHMLPRWKRRFGTTLSYHTWAEHYLNDSWSALLRLSGFYTAIHPLNIAQVNALILFGRVKHKFSEQLAAHFGLSSEIPGTSINRNSLQTLNVHLGVESYF